MKTERLLAITLLLLENKQMTAPQLAERFEVSVRTIYRDIDSLCQAGIPITTLTGSKGGIQILENYKIDNRFFSTPDLISLLVSLNSLNKHMNFRQTQFTIEKLKSLIPENYEKEIETKTKQLVIDLSPWTKKSVTSPFISLLQKGIENQQQMTFEYENRRGDFSFRTIEPSRLILKEISWYVQAYCCDKKDFRIFKLSRMKDLQLQKETFPFRQIPEASIGSAGVEENDFITIQLEADYSVLDQIKTRFDVLSFEKIENSSRFHIEMPFIPDEFGYHLLLGFGPNCKCLAPQFVQDELVKRIERMLALYPRPQTVQSKKQED